MVLAYKPKPEESNEFGPTMGDEIDVKVIASVEDEHAHVVLCGVDCSVAFGGHWSVVLSLSLPAYCSVLRR